MPAASTGHPLRQAVCLQTGFGSALRSIATKQGAKNMQLQGRTAIVTGAAQGIGAAVARAFADSGARVCAVDLTLERVEALADRLRAGGAEAIGIGCDVSRRDQVDAMVAATPQHFGRGAILINNAGITRPDRK